MLIHVKEARYSERFTFDKINVCQEDTSGAAYLVVSPNDLGRFIPLTNCLSESGE